MLDPELIPMVAARFKVLSEPARLAILSVLQGGEKSVGDLVEASGRSQPNISQHLASLLKAGLVTCRRVGRDRAQGAAPAARGIGRPGLRPRSARPGELRHRSGLPRRGATSVRRACRALCNRSFTALGVIPSCSATSLVAIPSMSRSSRMVR